jgi:hypothetical protein
MKRAPPACALSHRLNEAARVVQNRRAERKSGLELKVRVSERGCASLDCLCMCVLLSLSVLCHILSDAESWCPAS